MSASIDHLQAAGASRRRLGRCDRPIRRLSVAALAVAAVFAGLCSGPAAADEIKYPIAVFSGLDKITGRIITFDVATNETVQFGSLQITERVCYARPPTEAPQTDTFIEVDNLDADNQYKRIFTGWMFAGSPSLNPLNHPVYDIWLLRCKGAGELIHTPPEAVTTETPAPAPVTGKPQGATKPAPPAQAPSAATPNAAPPLKHGPIEVGPPPGFIPPSERPVPSRRFYPATPAPDGNDGF
ncbi:MAG: DUF2155 domain-containing protein [Methylovirgula sp.]